MGKPEILACTIRDGGYYTNWDFQESLVKDYCLAMEYLPIDYVEVGYRSVPLKGYLGEFFYCPEYLLKRLKSLMPSKKLAIILNEKDTEINTLDDLLDPCKPYIDLVRMAINPKNINRAAELAHEIKKKGFEVGFNVMYMSNWKNDRSFLSQLDKIDGLVDFFYMVDSYGGVLPKDVEDTIDLVKSTTNIPIAFHGHNNLEMAMTNTLLAMEKGCVMVDATITGMGRGAGNLKTELILTYLESKQKISFQINELSKIVGLFEKMQQEYKWGTSLPYMFSGAHSLPQKDVMDWLGLNRYPLSSIVMALSNKKDEIHDNVKLPLFAVEKKPKRVLVIGGGESIKDNLKAIKNLIGVFDDSSLCIVHAGVKNAELFSDILHKQYYCLVGSEGDKLTKKFNGSKTLENECIFPPYPRKMGTVLPPEIKQRSYELDKIEFTDIYQDSPLTIAAQTALLHDPEEIILVGFDGYAKSKDDVKFQLANENQYIIDKLLLSNCVVSSGTKTTYKNIDEKSLFSYFR
ncbi:MAG: aldolase catalytic domain-containing protein [Croceivirga sp.]